MLFLFWDNFWQTYFFDLILIVYALSTCLEGIILCQKSMVLDWRLNLLWIYYFRTINTFQSLLTFPILSLLLLEPSSRRPDLPTFYRFVYFIIIFEKVFCGFAVYISVDGNDGALAAYTMIYTLQWLHRSSRTSQVPYFQNALLRFRWFKSCEILVCAWTPVVGVNVVYGLVIFEIGLWFVFIYEPRRPWLRWQILVLRILCLTIHIKVNILASLRIGRILFRISRYHVFH